MWQVVPIVACVASISVETDRGTRGFYFWPRVKWNESQKINDGGGEGKRSERTRKVLTFLPHHSLLFSSRHFSRGLLLSFLVLCSETKMALNQIFLFILKLQKTEYLFKVLFLLRKLRRAWKTFLNYNQYFEFSCKSKPGVLLFAFNILCFSFRFART